VSIQVKLLVRNVVSQKSRDAAHRRTHLQLCELRRELNDEKAIACYGVTRWTNIWRGISSSGSLDTTSA
jgi:hypothetical protein